MEFSTISCTKHKLEHHTECFHFEMSMNSIKYYVLEFVMFGVLSSKVRVDSYGACLRPAPLPPQLVALIDYLLLFSDGSYVVIRMSYERT